MTESPEAKTGASASESTADRDQFEIELEFVQCLANPTYLNFLAQNEYLDSEEFIAYLKYLLYWRTPEYARFIVFPHALYFLHLLQEAPFREALKRSDYALMLHQQQGYHWQFEKTMKVRSETMNGSSGPENGDGEVGENKEGADGMEVDVGGTVGASTSTGMAKTVEV